jgi:hypothetical protein
MNPPQPIGDAQSVEIEPPYGIILDELRFGKAIPFLGAAASRVTSAAGGAPCPPSAADLAKMLAEDARFPSDDPHDRTDLAKVSSYYVDGSNRGALRRRLRRVFVDQNLRCNDLHRFLAKVADGMMIVTTNYDTLLEESFLELGKPYELVVYPADNDEYANGVLWWPHGRHSPTKLRANEVDIADLEGKNVIYKIHGSVHKTGGVPVKEAERWDSFVITEEDYVKFLSGMSSAVPPAFLEFFRTRAFLFLGYGLKDWNLRVLLKEVSVPERRSWAILHRPSVFERKLWERRRVDIFDVSLETFVSKIREEEGRA